MTWDSERGGLKEGLFTWEEEINRKTEAVQIEEAERTAVEVNLL